ncbi:TraM recognition domain-containing protein [Nonomuraea sp. NPDC003707]
MSSTRKYRGPTDPIPALMLGAAGLIVTAVACLWGAVATASALDASVPPPGTNPFTLPLELALGGRPWPGAAATLPLIGELVLLAAAGGGTWWAINQRQRRRTRVDVAAQHMAGKRELEPFSTRGATATAQRLGTQADWPGIQIGRAVSTRQLLYGSVEDMHVDIWGPRTGKALHARTPVLTPHGWTPISELTPGCRIIGADGHPTTVSGVYPQGTRAAWRIRFSDGTSLLCDADHLWTVRTADSPWHTLTTRQLAEGGLRDDHGAARYQIPIMGAARLEGARPVEREPGSPAARPGRSGAASALPLDPYVLGMLLAGDHLASVSRATVYGGPPPAGQVPTGPAADAGRDPHVEGVLAELGLLDCGLGNEHVPAAYLLAGISQRTALLHGLLEGGARLSRNGQVVFACRSHRLAQDLVFLVQSLGGLAVRASRRASRRRFTRRMILHLPPAAWPGHDDGRDDHGDHGGGRWHGGRSPRPGPPVRSVVAIEPEGQAEMVCISVTDHDGLYVAADCIVTHNTTSRAIPAIVDAPGACLVTSNKRDIVDATRGLRDKLGPVLVFDPQSLINEGPSWWWNPLSYVTDVDRASRMAALYAGYSRAADARTDGYFDPEGEALLAFMLLAAAEGRHPITQAYRWLTDAIDSTPADILRKAGHDLAADGVQGVINMPDKQRGGIYGTAKKSLAFLVNPAITRWVTPSTEPRPEFDPAAFARSSGTLYSLSQEGRAVAGPLVAALAVATIEAAEELASRSPGGRLSIPFLGVLDEAANTVRWRDLPNLYSHYGSRGILLMTILQTYAQGVEAWGEQGMAKLWGAANIRVFGGGNVDSRFLNDLSTLIGDFEPTTGSLSVSHSRGQGANRSYTTSTRTEHILDASDLFALPKGRALVFPSGSRAVLIETLPWQNGLRAEEIKASLRTYAPPEELATHELDNPATQEPTPT